MPRQRQRAGAHATGFTPAFFDEYHKHHPRSEPHHTQRIKLYELFHHLNVRHIAVHLGRRLEATRADTQHALMFGGGYKRGALGIMRELTTWAEGVQ
jgi:hypothetical protein